MDLLLLSAYGVLGVYIGFLVGLLIHRGYVERGSHGDQGGGSEPPAPEPFDPRSGDWAVWEAEMMKPDRIVRTV
jgi:hypothetical protein